MSRSTFTAGVDVGDRYSHLCPLDTETSEVVEESRVSTKAMTEIQVGHVRRPQPVRGGDAWTPVTWPAPAGRRGRGRAGP